MPMLKTVSYNQLSWWFSNVGGRKMMILKELIIIYGNVHMIMKHVDLTLSFNSVFDGDGKNQ